MTNNLGGLYAAVLAMLLTAIASAGAAGEPIAAEAIYRATGVSGGLVVHLGCGDGRLTAELRAGDRYVVHGLDTDPARVEKTRSLLHASGRYGPVSADRFDGRRLPYVADLVNLLVADDLGQVPMDEVLRVLAPGGVAYVRRNGTWTKTVKSWPDDVDQWTHFLHDAGGNAVARDTRVGPPKSLRWVAGPRWSRSHEFPSSVNAVVTASGRIFTIFDEGQTGVYKNLPQQCSLIARDASNGVLLWKVPMRRWQPEFGTGTGNRWNIHHTIPRRLVAEGDRVFVTLGFLDSPVSVLDAATGEILTEALEGTRGTDETILADGVLIVKTTRKRSVGATVRFGKDALSDTLAAVDVATGKQLWRKEDVRVVPYALSALAGRVVYHDMEHLVCLDARSGERQWAAANPIPSTMGGSSTLVIHDGVVLFHGHGPVKQAGGGAKGKTAAFLSALDLNDGKLLWRRGGSRSLGQACTQPTDVFVTGRTVWCGTSISGYDLRSGEIAKTLSLGKLISPGHHYRCMRGKATEQFLIYPKRGAEFVDVVGDDHMRNDWLRTPCFTGATPANGLFYAPPSQCFCYPGVLVSGFLAMSAEKTGPLEPSGATNLQRGPAFGRIADPEEPADDDWAMYRHNPARSGATKTTVPDALEVRWQIELACRASQPVIVGDRLWVAERDAHSVRCVSAANGSDRWSFTAGGRVDSTPTVHDGMVLFGCRDGAVYCLRATDGALVWRFRAAPGPERLVAFEQVESVWPVSGSVLVQDGTAYFAAGRSSFLNGGIVVYGLDPRSGEVRCTHHLEGPWPDVQSEAGRPFAMEGALPDLLVGDGSNLYMRRIKFDAELNRLPVARESDLGELDMGTPHLVATGGFLDDSGFDRLFWMHSHRWPGFYFSQQSPKAGQLVVFDESAAFAVKYFYRRIQWSPAFFPGEHGYLLFADDIDNEPTLDERGKPKKAIEWLPKETLTDSHRRGGRGVEKGTGYVRQSPAKWQKMVPLRIRAMVLSGNRLFAAGTPDVLDPKDPLAALEGRSGAQLHVYAAEDGALVESYPLSSLPAFDGLSAANGRLYLATQDGKVVCFGTQ